MSYTYNSCLAQCDRPKARTYLSRYGRKSVGTAFSESDDEGIRPSVRLGEDQRYRATGEPRPAQYPSHLTWHRFSATKAARKSLT
jgi:hypothetical protein